MPCFTPLEAYRAPGGGITLHPSVGYRDIPMKLECGQCRGCRRKRSRDWGIRCVHESRMHTYGVGSKYEGLEKGSFITLTYSDESLPSDGSLKVKDFQDFMKRLRKRVGKVRYLHCGEYAEDERFTKRAHYHALLFNVDFMSDRKQRTVRNGYPVYTSESLRELWPAGHHEIGSITFDSARYVASYIVKGLNGKKAKEVYGDRRPPYGTWSQNLGADWFKRYWRDVYPDDHVVLGGREYRPPKAYDRWLERDQPEMWDRVKSKRMKARDENEHSWERLRAKEKVADGKEKFFARPKPLDLGV